MLLILVDLCGFVPRKLSSKDSLLIGNINVPLHIDHVVYHPQGVLEVYMTGGVRRIFLGWKFTRSVFFWVKRSVTYFFRSYKKIRVFFWVLSPSELFVSGFRCDQWIRKYSFELFFSDVCPVFLYFFGLEILMPGIYLGLKFQACVSFWVCNMKLRQTPRHVYFEYPPGTWI